MPPAPPGLEAPPTPPGLEAPPAPPAVESPPSIDLAALASDMEAEEEEAPPAPIDPLAALTSLTSDPLAALAPTPDDDPGPDASPMTDPLEALAPSTEAPIESPLPTIDGLDVSDTEMLPDLAEADTPIVPEPATEGPDAMSSPQDLLAPPPAPPMLAGMDDLLAPPAAPESAEDHGGEATQGPLDDVLAPPTLVDLGESPQVETISDEGAPEADLSGVDLLSTPALTTEDASADPTPKEMGTEENFIAGAKIRRVSDVDAVRGDKLLGDLREVETSVLNPLGEILHQEVKGTVTVRNPSEKDRIWDIDVVLQDLDATNLDERHLQIQELEPGAEFTSTYKVTNERMLIIREEIDTNPTKAEHSTLTVTESEDGNPVRITITVENVSSVPLRHVRLTKDIPSQLTTEAKSGSVIEEGVLTWEVGGLGAGETQSLTLDGMLSVHGIEPMATGRIEATYHADSTLSSMDFEELDAFCRGFSYMVIDEDERPDNWKCMAVFENRSSFAVDLVKLQVRMAGSDEMLFDISDVERDVLPDETWESEIRTVEATERPDFTNELGYTVLPRASRATEGILSIDSRTFDVVEASVSKTYDTDTLRSYREQKVESTITVTNTGSATINMIRMTDDIPGMFRAPRADEIVVRVNGDSIPTDQCRIEIVEGVTLEPEHRAVEGPGHTLSLKVGTVEKLNLKPGKTMTITYALTAPDPSPENPMVAAPVQAEALSERGGPICTRHAESAPTLTVTHRRRKFSAGKQVIPVGGKGRYEVMIIFENRSDSALQDVILHDVLPSSFQLLDDRVRGLDRKLRDDVVRDSETGERGTHVRFTIPRVETNERIEISIEVEGDGEYSAEAMQKFHGVTFGDEVESDTTHEVAQEASPDTDGTDAEADNETADEAADETSSETADEAADEESEEQKGVGSFSWNDSVLEAVMDAHDIPTSDRDAFLEHAIGFDDDNNNYLKKTELTNAAVAWNEASPVDDTASMESEASSDEAPESSEEVTADVPCPVCGTGISVGSVECPSCGYTLEA